MARSSTVDPLEKFRFLVSWSSSGDSEATALVRLGFHDMQTPKRATTKGTYREGIDPSIKQLFAGLSTMEDVVLSRGVLANDTNDELYKWMSAVHNPSTGTLGRDAIAGPPVNDGAYDYRKDVTVTVLDREGNAAKQWTLFNAFPIHFVPGTDLNADEDGDKLIESLTLAYEDFQEETPGTQTAVAVSTSL